MIHMGSKGPAYSSQPWSSLPHPPCMAWLTLSPTSPLNLAVSLPSLAVPQPPLPPLVSTSPLLTSKPPPASKLPLLIVAPLLLNTSPPPLLIVSPPPAPQFHEPWPPLLPAPPLVFESPIRFGLLPIFCRTETKTGPPLSQISKRPD